MKVKLKFDSRRIQQFFLDHVEKMVIGGVILFFLVAAYESLSRKGYEQRPTALDEAVSRATSRIERGPDALGDYECKVPEIDPNPGGKGRGLDPRDYAWNVPLWIPPQPAVRRRDGPRVLPVKNLHGEAGRGALAATAGAAAAPPPVVIDSRKRNKPAPPPAAPEAVRGQRWVLLVGAVPIKEQSDDYKSCYQTASYKGDHDQPEYLGFFVERAEVGAETTGGQLNWSNFYVSTTTMKKAAENWHRAETEIVDPKLVHPALTFPLPSRTDAAWGEEAACGPLIPVLAAEEGGGPGQQRGAGPAGVVAPPHPGLAPVPGDAGRGPANPGGLDDDGKEERVGPAVPRTTASAEPQGPNYLLFRFFDFDVKPGKQYRYRVFLVLKNPNFGLPTEYLVDPGLAKPPWLGQKEVTKDANKNIIGVKIDEREAKWSEPSDPIAVPDDVELLVQQVKPRRGAAEPAGMVWVTAWAEKRGVKAHGEFPIVIGKVADFPGCHFTIAKPPRPGQGKKPVGPRSLLDSDGPTSVPVDYVTEQLVVDMTGGEHLPHGDVTLTRPGELVVMDRAGNLVIHDELQDRAVFDDFVKQPNDQTKPPPPDKRVKTKDKDDLQKIFEDPEDSDHGTGVKKAKPGHRP
jgi:hypothetical protein